MHELSGFPLEPPHRVLSVTLWSGLTRHRSPSSHCIRGETTFQQDQPSWVTPHCHSRGSSANWLVSCGVGGSSPASKPLAALPSDSRRLGMPGHARRPRSTWCACSCASTRSSTSAPHNSTRRSDSRTCPAWIHLQRSDLLSARSICQHTSSTACSSSRHQHQRAR